MASGPSIDVFANLNLSRSSLNTAQRQIQSAFNNVNVNPNRLNKFDNALGRITGSASEFNKSMDAATARVFAFGATVTVLNSVSQAFKSLVSSTIEVEKKLVEINSIFGGTQAQLLSFRKNIFDVAKNTEQSFDLVAEGMVELARQGLSVEESGKRLNAALILSRRSGLDATASVNALTAAINGFTSAGLEAEAITNKIVAVDTAFAVSAKDLADGLARAGSTAEDAGVSFDQLLGAITAIQQRTQRGGSVIGNAFKTILPRITRERSLRQLKDLGVDIDINQDGIEKLIAIAEALERITDPVAKNKIQEIAGGVRQINIVSALLKDLESDQSVFAEATRKAAEATNEAYKQNEELNKTLSAQINALIVGMTSLGSKLGDITLAPLIRDLVKYANTFSTFIDENLGPNAGQNMIKTFFEGIAAFLKGPGIVIITSAFINIFRLVGKFALEGLRDLARLGGGQQKIKNIEEGIVLLLRQDSRLRTELANKTLSQAQKHQAILSAIQRENQLLAQQQQIVSSIAAIARSSGVSNFNIRGGGFKTSSRGRFASGYTPVDGLMEMAEAKSLGAKGKVFPKMGRGKIGGKKFLMNNQEIEVPNFGKNGDSLVIPRYAEGNLSFNLGQRFAKELDEARTKATPLPSLKEFEKRFVERPLGIKNKKPKIPPLQSGRLQFSQQEFNKAFPQPVAPTPVPAKMRQAPSPISKRKIDSIFAQRAIKQQEALQAQKARKRANSPINRTKRNFSNIKGNLSNIKGDLSNSKGFGLTGGLLLSAGIPLAGQAIGSQMTKGLDKDVSSLNFKLNKLQKELSNIDETIDPKKYKEVSSELDKTQENLLVASNKQQEVSKEISTFTSRLGVAALILSQLPKKLSGPLLVASAAFKTGISSGSRSLEDVQKLSDEQFTYNNALKEASKNINGISEFQRAFNSELSTAERIWSGFLATNPIGTLGRIGTALGVTFADVEEQSSNVLGRKARDGKTINNDPRFLDRLVAGKELSSLSESLVKASKTLEKIVPNIVFEGQADRNFNRIGTRGKDFQLDLRNRLNQIRPNFIKGETSSDIDYQSSINKELARSNSGFDNVLNKVSEFFNKNPNKLAGETIGILDNTLTRLADPRFQDQANAGKFRNIQGSGDFFIKKLGGLGLNEELVNELSNSYSQTVERYGEINKEDIVKKTQLSIKEIEERRRLNKEFIDNLKNSIGQGFEKLDSLSMFDSSKIDFSKKSDLFQNLTSLGISKENAQSATIGSYSSDPSSFIKNVIGGSGTELRDQLFKINEAGLLGTKFGSAESSAIQGLKGGDRLSSIIDNLFQQQGSFAGLQGLQKAKSSFGEISSFEDLAQFAGLLRESAGGISGIRGSSESKREAALDVSLLLEQIEGIIQEIGLSTSKRADSVLKERDKTESSKIIESAAGDIPSPTKFGIDGTQKIKEFEEKKFEAEANQIKALREQATEYSNLSTATNNTKERFRDLLKVLDKAEEAIQKRSNNDLAASELLLNTARSIQTILGNNNLTDVGLPQFTP